MKKRNLVSVLILLLVISGCRPTEEYKVYALKYLNGRKIQADRAVIGANPADSVNVCDMFWLLRSKSGKNILVDAGFIDTTHLNRRYIRPDSLLLKMQISPEDISDIIITHPHYDHINGIVLFPKAQFWMQKEDYDYFVGPAWQKDGDSLGFIREDVKNIIAMNNLGRLKLVSGDNLEIMPGIKVFTGSKHTFQNQYLLINPGSDKNQILLASDAIWFYMNLEKELPITLCMDTASYVKAIKRMKTLVCNQNLIIPGHDDDVFSRFTKVQDRIVWIKE